MTQRLQGRRAGDARRKENLKKLTIITAEGRAAQSFQYIRDVPAGSGQPQTSPCTSTNKQA